MLQKASEDVAECLRRAAEAEGRAEAAINAKDKAEYLRIADTWRTLARSYEFQGSLGRFISFNESRKKTFPSFPPAARKSYRPPNQTVKPTSSIGLLRSLTASDLIPLLPSVLPWQA